MTISFPPVAIGIVTS